MKKLNKNKKILVKGWNRIFEDWEDFMKYLLESKSNLSQETIEQAIKKGYIKNIK